MKKTWGETWKRVIDLGAEKPATYIKQKEAFVRAANWAQNYIAQKAGAIVDRYTISQKNLQSALPSPLQKMDIVQHTGSDIAYSAADIKAYYFECDGNGECVVSDDNGETTVIMTRGEGYTAYKGFAEGNVSLTFGGDYAYNLRNIALYGHITSNNEADIPPYQCYVPYNIEELTKVNGIAVFMGFADDTPIHKGNYSNGQGYHEAVDYRKEQDKIILLNNQEVGEYEVWYKRYPLPIAAATPDDYELELEANAADIVPFLMAYTLWADDSLTKATYWWNTADNMISQLIADEEGTGSKPTYENTTGWW